MDVSLKNNKYIIFIHERALSLVYSDHVSSFDELLKKNRSFSIHYRNAQSLAIKFTSFFAVFLQVSWKMFLILTQIQYFIQPKVTKRTFLQKSKNSKIWKRNYIIIST